jgi:hypothetical protein
MQVRRRIAALKRARTLGPAGLRAVAATAIRTRSRSIDALPRYRSWRATATNGPTKPRLWTAEYGQGTPGSREPAVGPLGIASRSGVPPRGAKVRSRPTSPLWIASERRGNPGLTEAHQRALKRARQSSTALRPRPSWRSVGAPVSQVLNGRGRLYPRSDHGRTGGPESRSLPWSTGERDRR